MKKLFLFYLIMSFLLNLACKTTNYNRSRINRNNKVSKTEDSLTSFKLMDGTKAKVTVTSTEVEAKDFGEDFKVPTFSLSYDNANYVQILRCKTPYRELLKTLFDEDEKTMLDDGEKYKNSWKNASGQNKVCVWSSLHTTSKEFQDIAAPNGSYFYIINPCVSKARSATREDICSYDLTLTKEINFEASLSSKFIKKAQELEAAEAEHDGVMAKISDLTVKLMASKKECNIDFKNKSEKKAFDKRVGDIATLGGMVGGGVLIGLGARNFKKTSLIGRNPWGFAASIAVAAGGIATIIRRTQKQGVKLSNKCNEIEPISKEINELYNSDKLRLAKEKMVKLSKELNALNESFDGYDEKILEETRYKN